MELSREMTNCLNFDPLKISNHFVFYCLLFLLIMYYYIGLSLDVSRVYEIFMSNDVMLTVCSLCMLFC